MIPLPLIASNQIKYAEHLPKHFQAKFEFLLKFFGDIVISVTAIILAIFVYIQQRLGYDKLSQVQTSGQYKLLPSFRYERLDSKSFETEIVPDINNGGEN